MKKRKLIGVIISEVEGIYQNKLLKGIIKECYALNYDVAIFSTFIKNSGLPEYKVGEKNIYNLMNFGHFDGIIVAGITLAIDNLPRDIERLLKEKCRCPVLYIDEDSKHYPSIYTNDRDPSELITDHLIEVHNCRDIFCLAADPHSISTINRVEGYKNSLRKHQITVDDNKISYEGDFFYTGGEELARKIVCGEIPKPEAVVCISDHMAIGLVNELVKYGIRVPEDIIVTGYDAIDEAATSFTSITTYAPSVMQTGVEAVCELTRLMTDTKPEADITYTGSLEIGHSCGCKDIDYLRRSGIVNLKNKLENYKLILDSYMSESLTAASSFDECIRKFCYYLYLIQDYSDYYLCLCDNWDGSAENYILSAENDLVTGYTDQMTIALATENTVFVDNNYKFDTKDMIPDLWVDREKPKAYYFTPVHFNESCIGYSVLTYGEKIKAFDITYRNWSRNIMNALEFNRTHKKLYLTSFRDVLTGAYNRNGLRENLPTLINDVISQKYKLLVLMADLDNLKEVNDNFGHKEGDSIIRVVANALLSSCKGTDICARIGGDEFLVVGIDDGQKDAVNYLIEEVNEYIQNYNTTSKKPYDIKISMGAFSEHIDRDTKIQDMIDKADQIMYVNKAMNKKLRKL